MKEEHKPATGTSANAYLSDLLPLFNFVKEGTAASPEVAVFALTFKRKNTSNHTDKQQ